MNKSNSKLTPQQKQTLLSMRRDFVREGGTLASLAPMTVACMPTGTNTAEISTAIASPNEKKFRRKVGEYHALMRYYDGRTVSVPKGYGALGYAESLGENALCGDWFDSFGEIR